MACLQDNQIVLDSEDYNTYEWLLNKLRAHQDDLEYTRDKFQLLWLLKLIEIQYGEDCVEEDITRK